MASAARGGRGLSERGVASDGVSLGLAEASWGRGLWAALGGALGAAWRALRGLVGGGRGLSEGGAASAGAARGLAEAGGGRGFWAALGGAARRGLRGLVGARGRRGLSEEGVASAGAARGLAEEDEVGVASPQAALPLAGPERGRVPQVSAFHLLHRGGALHLERLARQCGPVLRMRMGGREVLVLGAAGPIREALARNWGAWMGRPPSYLGSLVSLGGQDLALGAPCRAWRAQRGAARAALSGPGLQGALRSQAEALARHHRAPPLRGLAAPRAGGSSLRSVPGGTARRVGQNERPRPRYVPCAEGLRQLQRLIQHRDSFVEKQLSRYRALHPEGSPLPPASPEVGGRPTALPPARLHMALVDLFLGGTETTAAALAWALALLAHRPELQARLRDELWRELGPSGTPEPGDTARLPLLLATLNETLRLRPPAPLALPHCALRHTSVAGVLVPTGSVLVPNLLAAHLDPSAWCRPRAFLPERFLLPDAPRRSLLPFGCGARSCVGAALARSELLVFLGRILWEFRIEPPAPGQLPGLEGTPGTVLRPAGCSLRLVPWHSPA
ncbi:steroid 21-hydroxylase-like isoform X2 [Cuculus canorus]|uniref:steroid 21-hydroxylase-like isoform X2 n=1 Tax=Cuculus canorus TaxID=55661 RepID=UPI0023AAD86C|nr:steroid 21-hydroxylase-like isoform X2 [Cuculus canorus]